MEPKIGGEQRREFGEARRRRRGPDLPERLTPLDVDRRREELGVLAEREDWRGQRRKVAEFRRSAEAEFERRARRVQFFHGLAAWVFACAAAAFWTAVVGMVWRDGPIDALMAAGFGVFLLLLFGVLAQAGWRSERRW